MFSKIITVITLSFIMTGCAIVQYLPLQEIVKLDNSPVNVNIMVPQDNIKKDTFDLYHGNHGALGNLVGRMIQEGKDNEALKEITAITESLGEFQFDNEISSAVENKFRNTITKLKINEYLFFKDYQNLARKNKSSTKNFSINVFVYEYEFTKDLSALNIRMAMHVGVLNRKFLNRVTVKDGRNHITSPNMDVVLSENIRTYSYLKGWDNLSFEERITKWAENDASKVKEAFIVGINESVKIFANTLERGELMEGELAQKGVVNMFGGDLSIPAIPTSERDNIKIFYEHSNDPKYATYSAFNIVLIEVQD